MPTPTATVEIGFDSEPFSTLATTWTDVTDYVALEDGPVQIDRGRGPTDTTMALPGTCTFTLNNDDKRFTPGYTGGPYGSNVIVGKRVRVTVTHNGTDYRRFTGHIASYVLGWPTGVTEQSRVVVTCVDLLGILSQIQLRNIVEHTYLTSGPVALWPLDDADDSQDAHEVTGYRQPHLHPVHNKGGGLGKFGGVWVRLSDGDAILGHALGLPSIPEKESRSLRIKTPRRFETLFGWTAFGGQVDLQGATTTVGVGYWVNHDAEAEDDLTYHSSLDLTAASGTASLMTGVTSKGRSFASVTDDSGSITVAAVGPRIVDGKWHHIYATWTETTAGEINLWVDGVLEDTDETNGGSEKPLVIDPAVFTIGAARRSDGTKEDNNPNNARFAYAGIWTDDTAEDLSVSALYAAGISGWSGADRTSARINRVLDWAGVPGGLQSTERGLSTLRVGGMSDMTAAEYIDICSTSEQGYFFIAGDGTATFHARDHRWEAASGVTLSWHQPAEQFTTDLEQYVNQVTVSYRGGQVRLSDRDSRALYGARELSLETNLADRNQAKGVAEYLLKLRETMRPRMDAYPYNILTEPDEDVRDDVLSLDLGSMFTVDDLPDQAHGSSLDFWVEGISETISLTEWNITFTTSPHKNVFQGYWVLGTSELDSTTKAAY